MHVVRLLFHGHVSVAQCEYCGYEKRFMDVKPQDIRENKCPLCGRISKPVDKQAEWVGY